MLLRIIKNHFRTCSFLLLILLFSCNADNDKKQQNGNSLNDLSDPVKTDALKANPYATHTLKGFSYSASDFFTLIDQGPLNSNNAKLILRLDCKNLLASDMTFDLIGNATANHGLHGSDYPNPILFTVVPNINVPTEPNKNYVFGNSEISLKKLKDLVVRGNQTLANFHHFVFYPMRGISTGNIFFKVYPADAQGTQINFQDSLEVNGKKILYTSLYSNPSPPKRPAAHNDPEETPE